jgi:hypothetical protein
VISHCLTQFFEQKREKSSPKSSPHLAGSAILFFLLYYSIGRFSTNFSSRASHFWILLTNVDVLIPSLMSKGLRNAKSEFDSRRARYVDSKEKTPNFGWCQRIMGLPSTMSASQQKFCLGFDDMRELFGLWCHFRKGFCGVTLDLTGSPILIKKSTTSHGAK